MCRAETSDKTRGQAASPRAGMTLVEILVVLGVFAVLAGVTLPLMQPWSKGKRVRQAGRIVQSAVIGLRDRAIRDADFRALQFDTATNRTIRYMDRDAAGTYTLAARGLADVELPDPTEFRIANLGGNPLVFDAQGTCVGTGVCWIDIVEVSEQGTLLDQRMAVVVFCRTGLVELYSYDNSVANDLTNKIGRGATVGR